MSKLFSREKPSIEQQSPLMVMDDPNLVLDFIRDEHLNVLGELKEHELNLRKGLENLPMDEDSRDLLAFLINSYLSFEKNAAKAAGQRR